MSAEPVKSDPAGEEEVEEINTPGTDATEGAPEGGAMAGIPSEYAEMLKSNPAAFAALQAMAGLEGRSSGLLESLPPVVKRRVKALKNLQTEAIQIDVKFHEEVAALEAKYHLMKSGIFEKRESIVTGGHEPTDEEATWEYDDDSEDEDEEEPAAAAADDDDEDAKGIPNFWLQVFQNCPPFERTIEEHDVEILRELQDVKLEHSEDRITFSFTFAENEHFTDTVLTKAYFLMNEAEPGDLSYNGMSYDHADGCKINWKAGKNITVQEVVKKQRKRGGANAGKVRIMKKTVPQESFFNFFSPPGKPTEEQFEAMGEEEQDELDSRLQDDFDLADMLKDYVVPCAVNWFTGDALDDFEGDEESDEEGMMGEDDDEDDEDPDYAPPANFDFSKADKPEDCKQQ